MQSLALPESLVQWTMVDLVWLSPGFVHDLVSIVKPSTTPSKACRYIRRISRFLYPSACDTKRLLKSSRTLISAAGPAGSVTDVDEIKRAAFVVLVNQIRIGSEAIVNARVDVTHGDFSFLTILFGHFLLSFGNVMPDPETADCCSFADGPGRAIYFESMQSVGLILEDIVAQLYCSASCNFQDIEEWTALNAPLKIDAILDKIKAFLEPLSIPIVVWDQIQLKVERQMIESMRNLGTMSGISEMLKTVKTQGEVLQHLKEHLILFNMIGKYMPHFLLANTMVKDYDGQEIYSDDVWNAMMENVLAMATYLTPSMM